MNKKTIGWLVLVPFVVAGGIQLKSCKDDFSPDYASLFVEMNGKKYGAVSGGGPLDSGRSWPLAQVEVYKDGDQFFVSPNASQLGLVFDAMIGNVTVSAKQEPTYDGYFVQGTELESTASKVETRATETLGVQESVDVVTIHNRDGESMDIKKVRVGNTTEQTCLTGCENRTFWSWAQSRPGKNVMAPVDVPVISVSKLAAFGHGATVTYDRELKVLLVKPGLPAD